MLGDASRRAEGLKVVTGAPLFEASRLHAWVTRGGRGGGTNWVDLGPVAPLEEAIASFLAACVPDLRGAAPVEGDRGGARREAGARLRSLLWDPLASAIGDAKSLRIAPDGALALLPFGMLLDVEGNHLLERFSISCVGDATELLHAPRDAVRSAAPTLLVVGAVDYDARPEAAAVAEDGRAPGGDAPGATVGAPRGATFGPWIPLSDTRREADGITRLHRRAFPRAARVQLLEEAATEERLLETLGDHSIVHLATHGYFRSDSARSLLEGLDDRPLAAALPGDELRRFAASFPSLLCGVVCAGANVAAPGCADGLLTGDEVAQSDLSRCDLAVLSACQTGLGRMAASGQGVQSLARAFRDAGARTVVASLWSVRDEPTKDLMVDFYDRLWNGKKPKLEALRDAQLALLRSNRQKFGDTLPATWGAFVLVGDVE